MPASLIHTVRLDTDGTLNVTFASRRDEATYRTAVDYALSPDEPRGRSRLIGRRLMRTIDSSV